MPSNKSGALETLYNSCTQACSKIRDFWRGDRGLEQHGKYLQKSAITEQKIAFLKSKEKILAKNGFFIGLSHQGHFSTREKTLFM